MWILCQNDNDLNRHLENKHSFTRVNKRSGFLRKKEEAMEFASSGPRVNVISRIFADFQMKNLLNLINLLNLLNVILMASAEIAAAGSLT